MNELDFDKLLSMEESIPAAKPQPEQKPEPPATTPPDPAPEETPAEMPKLTKPQLVSLTVLTALILVLGFLVGYLSRPAPTPEQSTAPTITATTPPSDVSALSSKKIYSDTYAVCYAYRQAVEIVTEGEQSYFSDGSTKYRLGETERLHRSDLGYYNVWIRVELTQQGKEQFGKERILQFDRNLNTAVDLTEFNLNATPYYTDNDNAADGWLLRGWMPEHSDITLKIKYTGSEHHQLSNISISPVVCDSNLTHYSTAELVRLLLNDNTFWKTHSGSLPEDLSDSPALAALSQRESSISVLMEYLLTGSSSEQKRAMATLRHKAFLDLMSSADRRAFYDMVDDYFSVTVYKERLTQVQTPPLVGERYGITYLLDSENAYRLGSPIPEPADGEKPINFFARLELSDYYRTLYHDGWQLLVDWQFTPGSLSTWQYFNAEGQVAGWFVFGYMSGGGEIEFQLIDASGSNIPLYTKASTISLTSGLVFAKSQDEKDSSGDVLPQKLGYTDNLLACYTYQEAPILQTTPGVPGGWVIAGSESYKLQQIPSEVADLDPTEYNLWIRIELTEEGRRKYTDPGAVWLDQDVNAHSHRLGITPYYTPNGALEGWFVFGCARRGKDVYLQRQGIETDDPVHFGMLPQLLWQADESAFTPCDQLVKQILTDEAMWRVLGDRLPADLSEQPLLLELSQRTNCVDMLLRYYASSTAALWPRIDLILQHPSFARQTTPAQQALWAQRDQQKMTVTPLSQRLTEYTDGSSHFFTDGTTTWPIHDLTPVALQTVDSSQLTCFVQVTLSDFCRQVGYDGWFLRVRGTHHSALLVAREYYDDSGALAGWFVYGKLPVECDAILYLENEKANTLESITLPLAPLA